MTDTQQDVVDVLSTDHTEAKGLIAQIRSTTDPEQRRDLADTLISELVRHSVAEEMYVYPAMQEHLADGAQAVEHDTKEHKQLERIMKEMEGADTADATFLRCRPARDRPPRPRVRRGGRAVPEAAGQHPP
jgi:hemerythrin superfamily protein